MNKDNKFTVIGFVVWIICAVFYLYEFLLRTVVGTFQHPIMQDFNLSSFKFSFLSSTVFMIAYATMQIPVSIIVSRIGLKKSLFIGISVCAFSTLGFGFASNYQIAILIRFFMGLGASFGFLCLLIAVYEWLPNRLSASFIGVSQFVGTMGPMFAAGPLEALSQEKSFYWKNAFIYLGSFGMALAVLALFFVKNNQMHVERFVILKRPQRSSLFQTLKSFLKPELWKIALFSAFSYFTIEYLAENEGKYFIMQKGFSSSFSSYMITLSWLSYAICCPLLGFISDFISRRRIVIIVASSCYLLSMIGFVFGAHQYVLIASFILLGVGASGQSIGFAIMAEQFKKENIAFGFGLNNTMVTILVAINAPLLGFIIDRLKVNSLPTEATYMKAFLILIGLAIGALILACRIKETYCKSRGDFTYLHSKTPTVERESC